MNAHTGFSNQNQFLSSNFLYSLPSQKGTEQAMAARLISCHIQNVRRLRGLQIDKAWKAISSHQSSNRTYVKPGKTLPLIKDCTSKFSEAHKNLNISNLQNINAVGGTNKRFPSEVCAVETGKKAVGEGGMKPPVFYGSQAQTISGALLFRGKSVEACEPLTRVYCP